MPHQMETIQKRNILLLSNTWSVLGQGINNLNRSIGLQLSTFTGVQVYNTVLLPVDQLGQAEKKDAQKYNITLLYANRGETQNNMTDAMCEFNNDPFSVFPDIKRQLPDVGHIIAHSPITTNAALKLRDLYPNAKVILVYHVNPRETAWLGDQLPYTLPSVSELVRQAELADAVYSVTEKNFVFFNAIFRNRATQNIDHHLLIPQGNPLLYSLERDINFQAKTPRILAVTFEKNGYLYDGLDIAACAANKVAANRDLTLVIGIYGATAGHVQTIVDGYVTHPKLQVEFHQYNLLSDIKKDLEECTVALFPSRCEPNGSAVMYAIATGTPILLSENSHTSNLVRRLAADPSRLLVPVTSSVAAVKQDASNWRNRIRVLLQDTETANIVAKQLKTATRRDEKGKMTYDDLTTLIIGGIRIRCELLSVAFYHKLDESRQYEVKADMNDFLFSMLRHCWRVKHHPLTQKKDFLHILADSVPVELIVSDLINKIEEFDRRITQFDDRTRSLIVYCPTADALRDLWAMCDVINTALMTGLNNKVLEYFDIKGVLTRTSISGPELLQYKGAMLGRQRPATAAF